MKLVDEWRRWRRWRRLPPASEMSLWRALADYHAAHDLARRATRVDLTDEELAKVADWVEAEARKGAQEAVGAPSAHANGAGGVRSAPGANRASEAQEKEYPK